MKKLFCKTIIFHQTSQDDYCNLLKISTALCSGYNFQRLPIFGNSRRKLFFKKNLNFTGKTLGQKHGQRRLEINCDLYVDHIFHFAIPLWQAYSGNSGENWQIGTQGVKISDLCMYVLPLFYVLCT